MPTVILGCHSQSVGLLCFNVITWHWKENRRRQKEEEEVHKQSDRAKKMAEFEKWKNPQKKNFVISKRATTDDGDVCVDLHWSISSHAIKPDLHYPS